jgi:hypothetical protein
MKTIAFSYHLPAAKEIVYYNSWQARLSGEVKQWCNANGISLPSITKSATKDMIVLEFLSSEEAVAFKMKWL